MNMLDICRKPTPLSCILHNSLCHTRKVLHRKHLFHRCYIILPFHIYDDGSGSQVKMNNKDEQATSSNDGTRELEIGSFDSGLLGEHNVIIMGYTWIGYDQIMPISNIK